MSKTESGQTEDEAAAEEEERQERTACSACSSSFIRSASCLASIDSLSFSTCTRWNSCSRSAASTFSRSCPCAHRPAER